MKETEDLWRRLAAFEIDEPDSALPFSSRLARDNGWSHEFALDAIEQYRRFVFLAMVAGHSVTPSDEVDQVWHLHLLYTRSYWDRMCGEVLGRPLHHGPTRGGAEQGAQFDEWYRNTLASYERLFGTPAPAAFWPAPEQRFARRSWRRVDVADALLLSRRRIRRQAIAAACAVLLLSVAGCTSMIGDNLGAVVVTLAIGGFAVLIWSSGRSEGGGGRSRSRGRGRRRGRRRRRGDDAGCGTGTNGDSGCGDSGCGGGCGGCGD